MDPQPQFEERSAPKTRDIHRAIVRLIQELEAIDWYHAPIGVVALDAQGHILAWNGAAGEILGVREWEALGTPLVHLFAEFDRAELDRLIARCIATDTRCRPAVFERSGPGGHTQFVEVTATGLRSRTGEPGATVLLQDVTARVSAERARAEAEQRCRNLVQGVDAIVWEADPRTFRFSFVSQHAEDILGYPVPQWLTEPDFWANHLHPDDRGRTLALRRTAADEGRDHELEYRMLAADGREVWVRDRVTVVRGADGEGRQLMGLILDITERKRTEEALARLFKQAADDVRHKDESLAILGHELRTPLGAITNALHVLEHAPGDEGRAARARAIIARQARHLTRLMDELLDVSRIGSGKLTLDPRPVDLNEVVRHSLQSLDERLGERRHDLVFTPDATPVMVHGDPVRLEQVVTNLVENAIKYTPTGGRVTISLRREGRQAVLGVQDTGIGIAAELLPKIFDSFYQVARRAEPDKGGLGLGLTLVRRLVELHGGAVTAHSAGPGQGSEFTVRLPLRPAAGGPRAPEPSMAPAGQRQVLIIEDDADTRQALKNLLELEGYRVEVAEDGPRGLEASRAGAYDAVLIDIALPGLGGYEVAQHLSSRGGRRPYLVALTGYSQPEDRGQAAEAGFDAYMVKPVDPADLSRLLELRLGS